MLDYHHKYYVYALDNEGNQSLRIVAPRWDDAVAKAEALGDAVVEVEKYYDDGSTERTKRHEWRGGQKVV